MASQKQPDSLVQYGQPMLVSTSTKAGQKGAKKKAVLPPIDKVGGSTRNEDYLNSILPPRQAARLYHWQSRKGRSGKQIPAGRLPAHAPEAKADRIARRHRHRDLYPA